jgi:hypothetical protein
MTTHYISEPEVKEKLSQMRKKPYWQEAPEGAFKEMEEVVGPRWITKEKVARQAYMGEDMDLNSIPHGLILPSCIVVLPASTQQVADIVKICINTICLISQRVRGGW